MLFNSYEFIFVFLPLTLLIFFASHKHFGKTVTLAWLTLASLFFYGWWNPAYLTLILFSLITNFVIGEALGNYAKNKTSSIKRKITLTIGIAFNLGLLGYFKYAGFFAENLGNLTGVDFNIGEIVLPLAISFFTFQQVAYLVDAYEGITAEYSFIHYTLFVTFFPQLIAGPIVHHKEILPQFMRNNTSQFDHSDIAIGITIFSIGLFKKAVIADGIAVYASPVFESAAHGESVSFFTAWGGSLAYTLQLYFDFSGYSDMAIGAARMFGITLPLNFNSPYKSTSIIEFWRRWHMTLSRFLRDYLYIRLGGNRRGSIHRYMNLMITMVLGGLWHGAGWTFIIWGALHGVYLSINHLWHHLSVCINFTQWIPPAVWRFISWFLTFTAVVVGWVFFRAENLDAAILILQGMMGFNGISLPNAIGVRLGILGESLKVLGISFEIGGGSVFMATWSWIAILLPLALLMPNTQEIMKKFKPALDSKFIENRHSIRLLKRFVSKITWKPNWHWAAIIALTATAGILSLSEVSEFLYFQF